jgi:hypothetical protein
LRSRPIPGPEPGSRYGAWAIRSLAAQRKRVRAIVLHPNEVAVYAAAYTAKEKDLWELEQLPDLLLRTPDEEPSVAKRVRKVVVAFNTTAEVFTQARLRGIEVVTWNRGRQTAQSSNLHLKTRRTG